MSIYDNSEMILVVFLHTVMCLSIGTPKNKKWKSSGVRCHNV